MRNSRWYGSRTKKLENRNGMKMWGDQNNEGRGEEAEEKGLKKVKGLPEPKDSSESLNDTHAHN